MKTQYLSCAETAKLIRAALKCAFPATKFSVKSKTYSGGASINVDWTDGPTDKMVSAVTEQFSGGHFDGSIDMATTHSSWLLADGSACIASDPGTSGSGGYREPTREWMPTPDAKLVSFGANFVFTSRRMSPAFAERVLAKVHRQYGNVDLALHVSTYDGSACLTGNYDHERWAREVANRFIIVRAS